MGGAGEMGPENGRSGAWLRELRAPSSLEHPLGIMEGPKSVGELGAGSKSKHLCL